MSLSKACEITADRAGQICPFAPAGAGAKLRALRIWLDTHSDQVVIGLSLLLGFWLVGNSLYYLA